jgi:transglutaminase-like putative cysteine protease
VPGTQATLQAIPDGPAGTRATLQVMARLIRQGKKNPEIRDKALTLTRHLRDKDWVREAKAIFHFVRDRIRYVQDVYGIETISEPGITLRTGQGDCDDKAVLAGALLQSIGHPVKLVAVAFDGGPFSHVFVETLVGPAWVPMELTESLPFGVYPEGITAMLPLQVRL